MLLITAPDDIDYRYNKSTTVFLGGSIANGEVEDWQKETIEKFRGYSNEHLTIFNPRRDDYDTSTIQTTENEYLVKQINWELDALEEADYVLIYFHPNTYAPISLLELGLHADSICKVVVCCPDDFYRQANVEIVCERYRVAFHKDLDAAIREIKSYIDDDQSLD
jgi:hypothetical protein